VRIFGAVIACFALAAATANAQQAGAPPRPYFVGNEGVGVPAAPPPPGADGQSPGAFARASDNVRMFGALYSVESCTYDATRGVIVAPSRGVGQAIRANDAWIALIRHDGSVHTPRWIGVQNAGPERDTLTPPLVLNDPFGSAIHNGLLYLADRDGGTADPANPGQALPSVAVIRVFDLATGAPVRAMSVPGSAWLNDIAIAADGTIYGTNSGAPPEAPDPATWQVWKITPSGEVSLFVQGAPLFRPNGVEIDGDGNIVVVNMGNRDVITFAPDASVVRTQQAVQAGSDGIVIMPDGVKFVSSVLFGGVSMIPLDGAARLIAENIPSAASMCYDSGANQLAVPLNANNGLAFISLDGVYRPRRARR